MLIYVDHLVGPARYEAISKARLLNADVFVNGRVMPISRYLLITAGSKHSVVAPPAKSTEKPTDSLLLAPRDFRSHR